MRVAIGSRSSEHLYPGNFTDAELAFARGHGVALEVRYSATARGSYLANVCGSCDTILGNWFLYQDPFHDTYRIAVADRQGYEGPCDRCSELHCELHGVYHDYEAEGQCPSCLDAAKVTLCRDHEGRECYYPETCDEQGCYFVRQEKARQREAEERVEVARQMEKETLAAIEAESEPLRSLIKGCSTCGASRREFRFQDGQAFCTRCGASQEADHFRA